MPEQVYSVAPFSPDRIVELCSDASGKSEEFCRQKSQITYLVDYLQEFDCKSILVESPYVDRNYLEDYTEYYARCFPPYDRFCKRLHFFADELGDEFVTEFLSGDPNVDVEALQDAYIGFSVLKPLPDAFVGRTCLKTYSTDGGRRHYPTKREYVAHVGGVDFEVDSLAFQEQDTVVAACATSALWSSLHKAGRLFGTRVTTPAEITQMATRYTHDRTLPSHDLQVREMCYAIKTIGLEVELRSGQNLTNLRELVYGYGAMGIPIILGLTFVREDMSEPYADGHAVTVTGFSIPEGGDQEKLKAHEIDRIYVHDDQHGPFARSRVLGPNIISTNWTHKGDDLNGVVFAAIVPVYHKIRITYENAREQMEILESFLKLQGIDAQWDIQLIGLVEYLRQVRRGDEYPPDLQHRLLDKGWPRFMWRLRASVSESPVVECLLDATDIERSFYVSDLFFFDGETREGIRNLLSDPTRAELLANPKLAGEDWVAYLQRKLGIVGA